MVPNFMIIKRKRGIKGMKNINNNGVPPSSVSLDAQLVSSLFHYLRLLSRFPFWQRAAEQFDYI